MASRFFQRQKQTIRVFSHKDRITFEARMYILSLNLYQVRYCTQLKQNNYIHCCETDIKPSQR